MTVLLQAADLAKTFTLHTQGGIRLPVFEAVNLAVNAGECLILDGPSGSGKSTLMRCLYGNYLPQAGRVMVRHFDRWVDLCAARPRDILEVRRHTLGYVSQTLRAIPRVPAIDVVAEPLVFSGAWPQEGRRRASELLIRLRIPERLWSVAPATFSGGEKQRINIARGFIAESPILLLDEPTASLDAVNAATVTDLILEAKRGGAAIVLISHDPLVRDRVGDRLLSMPLRRAA